jgi:hypothetical protein
VIAGASKLSEVPLVELGVGGDAALMAHPASMAQDLTHWGVWIAEGLRAWDP